MSKFRSAAESVSTSKASESDEVADDAPDVAHDDASERDPRRASSAASARAPAERGVGVWRGGWSALPVSVSAQLMVESGRGASPSQSGEDDSSDAGPADTGDAKTPDRTGDGVRCDAESGW